MRYRALIAFAVLAEAVVFVFIVAAWQKQPVSVPLRQTFDQSEEGWIPYGPGAMVRVTNRRENVKEGAGALELEYKTNPKQPGSAVLLVNDGALAKMRRLRFWLKTDDDTAVGVVLSEKKPDGGDYAAWFSSPKQQWQRIELLPTDFVLSEGPADAKDPNGRLDLDQLQAVGFIDLGQFFGLISQDPNYPLVLKAVSGTHHLQVDDFEILTDGAVTSAGSPRIGDPARGFVSWVTLGGAELSLSKSGKPLEEVALEVKYEQTQGKYIAVAHALSNLELAKINALAFDTASLKRAAIMVYLEERSPGSDVGPRYAAGFEVAGGSKPSRRILPLSEFAYDSTSPRDPDGRLTPGRLKSISLIDITGAALSQPERNTLWISAIEGIAR